MTSTVEPLAGGRALDPDACYRAVSGRDPRFDGRVYLGVVTTGVYCRPSCPARTPRPENCRYFSTAAAAVAAGFRACRRCRPDALPGSREWDHRTDLAARAVRLIGDGAVDEVGVAGLATRLHVSERHLHRVLVAEVGASPQQLARTRRAQTARMLVEQTSLSMTDIAFAAGFASVRQFNDVMRAEFGTVPTALRRPAATGPTDRVPSGRPAVAVRLRFRRPLALDPLARFLAAHAVPGLERVEAGGTHVRTVPAPGGPALVRVGLADVSPSGDHVPVRLQPARLADLAGVVTRVRRWLDLDADPVQVDAALAGDPALGPLVAARPGLRVPGAVDGTETAVLAVLGQHVSLRAARTFAARLVEAYGPAVGEDGLRAFPATVSLAEAEPAQLREVVGVTGARARTVVALARAVAAGELDLSPGADRQLARRALRALPGVGPWTAEYVALRSLGDPDAYPAGDLVLRSALGVRTAAAAAARAEAWRPWRGYALLHLWTREVFS